MTTVYRDEMDQETIAMWDEVWRKAVEAGRVFWFVRNEDGTITEGDNVGGP